MQKIFILTILIFIISLTSCTKKTTPGTGGTGGTGGDGIGIPPTGCNDKGTGSCAAVGNVLSWLTEEKFKKLTPLAHPGGQVQGGYLAGHTSCHCQYNAMCGANEEFYTYKSFVSALNKYPDVLYDTSTRKIADDDQQRRIIAAIFANSAQETNAFGEGNGWSPYGVLCWVSEAGTDDTPNAPKPRWCDYGGASPSGYCYTGRGPLQLTWKVNYENFSRDYFGDDRASRDPRIVTSTGEYAFASAFWYFANYVKDHSDWKNGPKGLTQFMVTPRKYKGKKRDFSYTIFLINGGIECGSAPVNTWGAKNRVTAFKAFFQDMTGRAFNDPDDKLECEDMQHVGQVGAELDMSNAPVW